MESDFIVLLLSTISFIVMIFVIGLLIGTILGMIRMYFFMEKKINRIESLFNIFTFFQFPFISNKKYEELKKEKKKGNFESWDDFFVSLIAKRKEVEKKE